MWEYYRNNKASLPKWIGEFREDILHALVLGGSPQLIFDDFQISET
jgi:hypothetical protein